MALFPWRNKGESEPTKLNRQNLNAAEELKNTQIEKGEIPIGVAGLPGSVEIGGPAPTGVAATDTTNVKATLKAAGEAKGVAVFNKGGVYSINEELTRPPGTSVYIGPGTTIRAAASMTCLLTDSAATKDKDQSLLGGGTLDSNKLAAHALWCRYFQHMTLGVKCANSLEDDVILGSEEAAGASVEPILTETFLVRREYTATSKGFSCVNATRASDGRVYGSSVAGQETGLRLSASSGGWRTFGLHPIGSGSTFQPMQVCVDDGSDDDSFAMLSDRRSFAVFWMPTWKVRPEDALPSSSFCPLKSVTELMRLISPDSCLNSVWM